MTRSRSTTQAIIRAAALWSLLLAVVAGGAAVSAQDGSCESCGAGAGTKRTAPKPGPEIQIVKQLRQNLVARFAPADAGIFQEKAIAVSPKVYVSVCVRRGTVRVNGWGRNEARVFHGGDDELGIKVLERDERGTPAWIEILGFDPAARGKEADKCLSGEMIELDVPEGATVTIKGLSSETSVERVRSAAVEIVGGDIYLSEVSERIEASTQQGGVTVKDSRGRVSVSATTGNIVAYNTKPVEPGDYFRAKTRSGAVTLQSIGQRDVSASTISGSINYVGEITNYGRYEFTTTGGLLNLVLPESASFWLTAAYGGELTSDFPMELVTENITEEAHLIRARIGNSEANVSLKSFSGTIRIRKQETPDVRKLTVTVP